MKSAHFNFTSTKGQRGYGKVTLKDDGKISVTDVFFPSSVSYATKYELKEYAKKIVELDFPSDMCNNVQEVKKNSNLVQMLFEQTQELKQEFLDKSKSYAIINYDRSVERKNWKEADWCKYFGLEPRKVNEGTSMEFLSFPQGFHNTKTARTYKAMKDEVYYVTRVTKEEYIAKELKNAEMHYEASIQKLALRIMKKNLDESKLKMVTGRVGVNITTTLTDGTKTVRAWTIVAEGIVQRPHYRYLVK